MYKSGLGLVSECYTWFYVVILIFRGYKLSFMVVFIIEGTRVGFGRFLLGFRGFSWFQGIIRGFRRV